MFNKAPRLSPCPKGLQSSCASGPINPVRKFYQLAEAVPSRDGLTSPALTNCVTLLVLSPCSIQMVGLDFSQILSQINNVDMLLRILSQIQESLA